MIKWLKSNSKWATTALRIVMAFVFIYTGYTKLFGGLEKTTGLFESLGIPFAGFSALLVALVEFVGGMALLVGAFTRITAALISVTMVVALLLMHIPMGFVDGGAIAMFHRAVLALGVSVSLMFSGAGHLSVDEEYFND